MLCVCIFHIVQQASEFVYLHVDRRSHFLTYSLKMCLSKNDAINFAHFADKIPKTSTWFFFKAMFLDNLLGI